jgi:hypothetical protein
LDIHSFSSLSLPDPHSTLHCMSLELLCRMMIGKKCQSRSPADVIDLVVTISPIYYIDQNKSQ